MSARGTLLERLIAPFQALFRRHRRRWEKTAILVLGMHRSGTSAITRVLSLIGATLPKNLMPPRTGNNERGFWESALIMQFNDQVLADLNSTWDDARPLPEDAFQGPWFWARVAGAREILLAEFGDARFILLKDPRICRLAPIWIEALSQGGYRVKYVIPIRNPLEVAASLSARDHFTERKGLILWLRHLLDSEKWSETGERVFVRFDHLLGDWVGTLHALVAALDLDMARLTRKSKRAVDEFLANDLRHQVRPDQEVFDREDIPPEIQRTYAWALSACAPSGPDQIAELDAVRLSLSADPAPLPDGFSDAPETPEVHAAKLSRVPVS